MDPKIRDAPGILRDAIPKGIPPLPKEGEENILITSALPYCNNVPHLGNIIGSTLSADVFSRYNRARNRKTLYICGTDEYGTATETQALKEKKSPRELCDYYNVLHREVYEWFGIDFSYFGRTSTPAHTEICQEIYLNLRKNNMLVKEETIQVYCEGCEKFLADRFVEGTCPHCGYSDARGDQCDSCSKTLDSAALLLNPRCIISGTHNVTTRSTSHMYIRLDAIQPQLVVQLREAAKKGNWTGNAVISKDGEIIDWRMKAGLKPSPITRDLKWGVPVPTPEGEDDGMDGKVFYVWYDAPIGYPSITANFTPEWKQWWFNPQNVKLYQFMGKDNVYFHTVLWPACLLGDGRAWTRLFYISATEFLNYEGGKFSKSRNCGVFGPQAKETGIPPDVWRYYLLANRPETGDTMFSWTEFILANNSVLLNNFGNFVNRTLKFIAAKRDGVVPDSNDEPGTIPATGEDEGFINDINAYLSTYISNMESLRLRDSLEVVMRLSARGNLYLQQAGLSNALLAESPQRCDQVLHRAVNLIWALSALIWPFMPVTAESIGAQLNVPARAIPTGGLSNDLLAGHKLGTPEHLFKKIDESMGDAWRVKFGGDHKPQAAAGEKVAAATGVAGNAKGGVATQGKRAAEKAKKAAKKAAEEAYPDTEGVQAAKEKVEKQGAVVRDLKAKKGESPDEIEELEKAVKELLSLKGGLAAEVEKAKAEQKSATVGAPTAAT